MSHYAAVLDVVSSLDRFERSQLVAFLIASMTRFRRQAGQSPDSHPE